MVELLQQLAKQFRKLLSPRVGRTYTRENGYKEEDLLRYAADHLTAAEILFDRGPSLFDSAGYLGHVAIELLLKAWHLHAFDKFTATHSLKKLYKGLKRVGLSLDVEALRTLKLIDMYAQLRYPRGDRTSGMRDDDREIGNEDWQKIRDLSETIWEQMPSKLAEELETSQPNKKGGRILMRKRIDYNVD